MSEDNRFIKNKKMVALSISLVAVCILSGVLGASLLTIDNEYNGLSGDYDELYIDYLELLYDYNVLTEKYNNLTGEHIILEDNYNNLLADYNTLLMDYNVLLNAYNTLLDTYNTILEHLTLTYIETLCSADTYVSDMYPETNYGSEQYWDIGKDEYTWEFCMAFFNFSLINKPETYEKVEIQLHFTTFYPESIWFPIKFFQDWDENTLTYNNTPPIDPIYIPFSIHYNLITYSMSMIIDVTDWINTGIDSISIVVGGTDYAVGYSREHPNQDLVPKLIWTVIESSI